MEATSAAATVVVEESKTTTATTAASIPNTKVPLIDEGDAMEAGSPSKKRSNPEQPVKKTTAAVDEEAGATRLPRKAMRSISARPA